MTSAVAFGVPAEAFVLVIYKERRSVGTSTSVTRHSILAFRTPDGREYRIDEQNGLRRAVGDRVGVRYLPERPDRAVTVDHGTLEDTICVAVGALLILGGLVGVIITLGHLPPRPPIVIPQWRH
ncbi:DUF3592 domain-containing protein [Kitasatospora sp. NPDC048407]|uniref:DUF3592 domain-containing protein n=1 Tax=Kitasatospora sp. NPDC048407 TaxID=3364051 RepID=UPI00371F0B2B